MNSYLVDDEKHHLKHVDELSKTICMGLLKAFSVNIVSERIWDKLSGPRGVLNPDGWKLLCRFVGSSNCFVFEEEAKHVVEFETGDALRQFLEDRPPFEFYVCDSSFKYLLCFNHHDYLIGWGEAEGWVNSLRLKNNL